MQVVFICYTPLHALQAMAIIHLESIDDSSLIYLASADNAKHRYYFNQCALLCRHSLYRTIGNNPLLLRIIANECRHWIDARHCTFYTGNLKKFASRFLLEQLNPIQIGTFDDGINNIAGKGYFYENKEHWISRIWSFFRPGYSYRNLRSAIKTHYSLYDLPNVYGDVRRIELFPVCAGQNPVTHQTILLGSPLAEDGMLDLAEERALYEQIIAAFNVDLYLPHPREHYAKISEQSIVLNTHLIAEEYLYRLSQRHGLRVIGIGSSALLHLHNYSNIKCINIHLNMGQDRHQDHTDAASTLLAQAGIDTFRIDTLDDIKNSK